MAARWIEPLSQALRAAPAFRDFGLRPAAWADEDWLFALHRDAMREYVDRAWGWDEAWQRNHFAGDYAPVRNAVILRTDLRTGAIGRISLSLHWRRVFLRDIELVVAERNQGLGAALLRAVIALARADNCYVELLVLKCNPAQRLYKRLGFEVVADDGARLTMRAR
jgi:ribosomal protein S18 acetylase RimI-like enzyme